jgi:hypothetical protein
MGSLCWARRNVVLALVDAVRLGAVDAEVASDALTASAAELDRVREQLPSELADFAERFDTDLTGALSQFDEGATVSLEEYTMLFAFEAYPEVAQFVALAQQTPDCVDM